MTPFMSLLLPIGLAAFGVFVLSMLLHMVVKYHRTDYIKLPDEDGVRAALRPFNIPPGDYMVPRPGDTTAEMKSPEYDAKMTEGPVLVLTVISNGPWNMGRPMGQWFLFVVVVTAAVACIVGTIVPPGGDSKVVFHHTATISFLTYAMGAFPLSIWYQRKWSTGLKNAFDSLLFALLAAWIFSAMWPMA